MVRSIVLVVSLCSLLAAGRAPAAAPACWDYGAGGWAPAAELPAFEPAADLALTTDGRLAAAFSQGVGIYDVTDALAARLTAFLPTAAPVTRVAAWRDRLLALTSDGALYYAVLPVAGAPAWGDTLALDERVDAMALEGDVGCLVLDGRALMALDLADPKHVVAAGFVLPPSGINALAVDHGLAILATQLDRFYAYDVSDPYAPAYAGSPLEGLATSVAVACRFPTVYAASTSAVRVYDVSDPSAPTLTGVSDVIATRITSLAVAKDRLFALTDQRQAVLFSAVEQAGPHLLGHAVLPGAGLAAAAVDSLLFVAAAGSPPLLLDASAALHADFDRQALPWRLEAADLTGQRGYAMTGDGLGNHRLEVLSFSGVDSLLVREGTLPTYGTVAGLAAAEPLVAWSSSASDLTIVDVSDPAAPRYLAVTGSQSVPRGLLLMGSAAYVASNTLGLVAYDISEAGQPRPVGQLAIPRTQVAWAALGHTVLIGLTGDLNGMFVVDCADPARMTVQAWVAVTDAVVDVVGSNGRAYVADAVGRVHVFDIADRAAPRSLGWIAAGDGPGRLAAYGRHVYYVDARQGVVVLDGGTQGLPALVGQSLVPLDYADMQLRPDGIVLTSLGAIARLPLPCNALAPVPGTAPVRPLLAAAPNPFNPRTVLSFDLPAAGPCRLAIHDLRGRLVDVLLDGAELPAGPHSLPWDGRGRDGRLLPSGVYLARLTGGAAPVTARLTLVR